MFSLISKKWNVNLDHNQSSNRSMFIRSNLDIVLIAKFDLKKWLIYILELMQIIK